MSDYKDINIAQGDAVAEELRQGFWKRHRKAGVIGGGLGTLGVGGLAFALVFSGTQFVGDFSFDEKRADDKLASLVVTGEAGLNCDTAGSGPEKAVVSAVGTKVVSEDGQSAEVPNQQCEITAGIKNQGEVDLYINAVKSAESYTGPAGWQIYGLDDDHGKKIEVGTTTTVVFYVQIDDEGTMNPPEGQASATFFTQTGPVSSPSS